MIHNNQTVNAFKKCNITIYNKETTSVVRREQDIPVADRCPGPNQTSSGAVATPRDSEMQVADFKVKVDDIRDHVETSNDKVNRMEQQHSLRNNVRSTGVQEEAETSVPADLHMQCGQTGGVSERSNAAADNSGNMIHNNQTVNAFKKCNITIYNKETTSVVRREQDIPVADRCPGPNQTSSGAVATPRDSEMQVADFKVKVDDIRDHVETSNDKVNRMEQQHSLRNNVRSTGVQEEAETSVPADLHMQCGQTGGVSERSNAAADNSGNMIHNNQTVNAFKKCNITIYNKETTSVVRREQDIPVADRCPGPNQTSSGAVATPRDSEMQVADFKVKVDDIRDHVETSNDKVNRMEQQHSLRNNVRSTGVQEEAETSVPADLHMQCGQTGGVSERSNAAADNSGNMIHNNQTVNAFKKCNITIYSKETTSVNRREQDIPAAERCPGPNQTSSGAVATPRDSDSFPSTGTLEPTV
ncbi:uncharacterized protein TC_0741-like [Haliotis rubra]|uniref:uncharacterized protein TC_0741-like n=1 Tax=Haliotis rubra TaxID=36100 RepID=UPI001EE5E058|nr:uncharacterized protein TC_0741-like [Haliotis rubra]